MTRHVPTPVNLVTGLPGAGKTRAIVQLLAHRPADERWAVLAHDAPGTAAAAGAGAVAREAAVGCPCCMGTLPLRAALVDLLRREWPDRLLIEPHGAAHTDAILALLREPALAGAVDLRATLYIGDTAFPPSPAGRAQLGAADRVVWTGDGDPPADLGKPAVALAALDASALEAPAAASGDPLGLRRLVPGTTTQKTI